MITLQDGRCYTGWGGFAQVRAEIAGLGRAIHGIESTLRGEMHRIEISLRSELFARMDRQFFWVLGLLVVSILLPVAFRFAGH